MDDTSKSALSEQLKKAVDPEELKFDPRKPTNRMKVIDTPDGEQTVVRLGLTPGTRFARSNGEQYVVAPDGSYKRTNKKLSKKKLRRLDGKLKANGSSLGEFMMKIQAIRENARIKAEEQAA